MIYFQLFLSFFQIGLLSFGGGYAAMPLIQGQVVQGHGWLSMSEFTDLITISQMTPGPIAVNSATFVGIKIAGIPGALVATFGCILPSCILVTLLAKLYLKYREMAMLQGILHSLRPAVVAMIGSAGISILVTAFWSSEGDTVIRLAQTNWSLVVIFIISLILLQKGKKNPIFVMVLAGAMKVAVALVEKICGMLWDDFLNSKVNAFQDVLNSKIYIDKTGLLEYTNSVIDTTSKFICNSRPRRFGKSITADMMTAYYSRSLDTEEMFEKLNIGQAANQKIQDEYQTADS